MLELSFLEAACFLLVQKVGRLLVPGLAGRGYGRGGSSCAQYCAETLHLELKYQLDDVIHGIENSEDLN